MHVICVTHPASSSGKPSFKYLKKFKCPHVKMADVPFSRVPTPENPLQLGCVGLGAMGYCFAKNLATHRPSRGPRLSPLVWNRSTDRTDKLLKDVGQEHVRVAKNLEQIVTECDVIFTCLANDNAVKSVYQEFANTLSVRWPIA
jgi:hypothetical protein